MQGQHDLILISLVIYYMVDIDQPVPVAAVKLLSAELLLDLFQWNMNIFITPGEIDDHGDVIPVMAVYYIFGNDLDCSGLILQP